MCTGIMKNHIVNQQYPVDKAETGASALGDYNGRMFREIENERENEKRRGEKKTLKREKGNKIKEKYK